MNTDRGRTPALTEVTNASGERAARQTPIVVGIGASAGGLKALQAFFGHLPQKTGMSFVVILHLDPKRESSMDELLQLRTEMPVVQVTERVKIEPDHVYVIPPGKRLQTTDSELSVSDFEERHGQRMPIDHFFRSLASAHGDGVGIILSGGGTDGSVGIKAIKEAGGLVFVQAPTEADYDAMPRSAIATGVVDKVLPVREMARQIIELTTHPVQLPADPSELADEQESVLRRVLARLRTRSGHDFTDYKRSTVLRRIRRRMQVNHMDSLEHYLDYLAGHAEEAKALFRELLIGVTTFFREGESFEALEQHVIPKIFSRKEPNDTIRVWVVGCSTGEEAYSVAMLLQEYAADVDYPPDFQVFASDLDEGALATAREGLYPASIEADVSKERLRQFFTRENNHYRVNRSLRDKIIFATHSVLRDPPFSRLDLISCRNLLIYLQRERQQQVFSIFHYALRPGGYLFLGRAESAEGSDRFQTIDKTHRLYQARERTGEMPQLPTFADAGTREETDLVTESTAPRSEAELHRQALDQWAPPSALVDEEYHVVHLSRHAGRYMQHPGGTPTNDIVQLVRKELQVELRSALFQAFEKNQPTVARPVEVRFNGNAQTVYLTVRPHTSAESQEPLALVMFNEGTLKGVGDASAEKAPEGEASTVGKLREELEHTRKQLQTTLEEYESSREELKAQNEELRSMNEEYKSTMEELETSKEELQSVNEELQTVNSELQAKLEEVSRAHSDLRNIMEATDVGIIFLDRGLRIKRFTPQVEAYFNIRDNDRGRPIGDLTNKLKYDELENDAERVLDDLRSIEREIWSEDSRCYLMRMFPYRTVEDKIDGVVVNFVDITEIKRTQDKLRQAKKYAETIVDTVNDGLVVLTEELHVQSANQSFYAHFGTTPKDTEGRLIYELGDEQWDIPRLRELLEDVLSKNNSFSDFEVTHTFDDLGERTMLLNARRLDGQDRILLAIDDITERRRALDKLRELNDTLERRVEARTEQIRDLAARLSAAEQKERKRVAQILHDDLQQQLYGIQMKIKAIRNAMDEVDSGELLQQVSTIEEWIANAIQTTRQLAVDLSPPVLKNEGLVDSLDWLRTQMNEMHGLSVEITADDVSRVPDATIREMLFQIIRELLFNVVKHAGVDEATVQISESDDGLTVSVIDAGSGFDADRMGRDDAEEGFGLPAIRDRIKLIGGQLEIQSAPEEGTRATIRVPRESIDGKD